MMIGATNCAKIEEKHGSETIQSVDSDVYIDEIQYSDGEETIVLRATNGENIDLTNLDNSTDTNIKLNIVCEGSLDRLVLPDNYESIYLDVIEIGYLDAKHASKLNQLFLTGSVRAASKLEGVKSLYISGTTDISVFADSSIERISVTKTNDLSGIELYPHLEDLYISRNSTDDEWDLSVLHNDVLKTIRISGCISVGELTDLSLNTCETVQINDRYIDDISWIFDNFASIKRLILSIPQNQCDEILEIIDKMVPCDNKNVKLINSSIPYEQLKKMAEQGDLYLFSDFDR